MVSKTNLPNFSETKLPIFGRRHVQCLLLFCGLSTIYGMRANLSVAIVAMMDKNTTNPDFPEYKWSEQTKSKVLSSFFCGYICTQLPAGGWARRFGGKVMLMFTVTSSSILSILTPLGVSIGDWQLLCALRFLQGFGQGATIPAMATILAKWSPVEERSSLATYVFSGAQFGTVIMLASSGALASSSLGWPSIFYIPGGLGLFWILIWLFYGASSPSDCKVISEAELSYIEMSLSKHAKREDHEMPNKVPWCKILTSAPFLALLVTHCGHTWTFWTLLTQIPSYMKSVLGKDIKSNALLSSLPYLSMVILGLVCCPFVNALEKSKLISTTVSRKIFNTIGQWIPVITFIWLGYVNAEQSDLAVALLTVTVSLSAITHFGWQVNHIDLSPHFTGTLVGMSNTMANVMSIIAPLVVGYIVIDPTNPVQWRVIFFIAGGFNFVGNLLFITFGTAKVQPWHGEELKVHELKPLNEDLVTVKVTQEEKEEKEREEEEAGLKQLLQLDNKT
ncbi:putative inorganic phosphate cotransporter isoform X1 [Anastrepha obliqua]|uniref:putative inorganic phosphate cotransporter isoform X1 n=2 Tax=Anastrepha obliqua TaxID=95512 RepID=UPI00240A2CB3|nr:putative inorganic phosphate cotransporter isoform X1 [Anastrepha obliqua]